MILYRTYRSGKTTTLYTILRMLNREDVDIVLLKILIEYGSRASTKRKLVMKVHTLQQPAVAPAPDPISSWSEKSRH